MFCLCVFTSQPPPQETVIITEKYNMFCLCVFTSQPPSQETVIITEKYNVLYQLKSSGASTPSTPPDHATHVRVRNTSSFRNIDTAAFTKLLAQVGGLCGLFERTKCTDLLYTVTKIFLKTSYSLLSQHSCRTALFGGGGRPPMPSFLDLALTTLLFALSFNLFALPFGFSEIYLLSTVFYCAFSQIIPRKVYLGLAKKAVIFFCFFFCFLFFVFFCHHQ